MRDRLFRYLQSAGRPLTADQVLREVLHISSPNTLAAHRVLKSIVRDDRRFRCSSGLWRVSPPDPGTKPLEPVALFVEEGRSRPDRTAIRGAVWAGGEVVEFGNGNPDWSLDPGEIENAALLLRGRALAVWDSGSLRVWRRALQCAGFPPDEGDAVPLTAFLRRVFPTLPRVPSFDDAASRLSLAPPDPERPAAVAGFIGRAFSELLNRSVDAPRSGASDLLRWIREADVQVDFSRFAFRPEMLAELPPSAGVYVMRDVEGNTLYVGKAANLRRRVRSYFFHASLRSARIRSLHEQLHTLEVIPANSEVEALILELRLIGQLQPRVNVQAEVHESQAGYGRERNLILLVPHDDGDRVCVYFLREGFFVDRLEVPLGRAPGRTLRARVHRIYYGNDKNPAAAGSPSDREIIFRWFARNRRNLNLVDIDDAGTFESALRCLTGYLLDPGGLKARVIYR